jgi:hypothetical protein
MLPSRIVTFDKGHLTKADASQITESETRCVVIWACV